MIYLDVYIILEYIYL